MSRTSLLLLTLAACATTVPGAADTQAPWALEVGTQAPPPVLSTPSSTPTLAHPGELVTLSTSIGRAGVNIYFAVSTHGLGAGDCPPPLLGGCLAVASPSEIIGPAVTDAGGTASISWTIPADQEGAVAIQAVARKGTHVVMSSPHAFTPEPGAGDVSYGALVRAAVDFYGAQRCGDAHNWLLTDNPYGDSCHPDDGPAVGADLTGGWHDAGDHLKFTSTHAYASYTLLKALEVFPEAFEDRESPDYSGVPNGVVDVLDQVRVATDYLVKAHIDSETLAARVGDGRDHEVWTTSPFQSTRPAAEGGGVRAVSLVAKADVAGLTTAALALASTHFEAHDPALAATYLDHAREIYEYGIDNPGMSTDEYYAGTAYKEDMMCGAIELHRATGEGRYLADAEIFSEEFGRSWWAPDWENPSDYCRHSMYMSGSADALAVWKLEVDGYLDTISTSPEVAGMAYFFDWGTLQYASGAAFSAAMLHEVTGDPRYADFAMSQLEYITGDNGYGRSFVVGFGEDPPSHPHHKNAFGREAHDWDLTGDFEHVLTGALVGGPTIGDLRGVTSPGYEDDVWDYAGNEVSIAYNAGLVGLAAFGATAD
jgi:endoglucanase